MIYNYYVSIWKNVSASYTPLITDRNLQKDNHTSCNWSLIKVNEVDEFTDVFSSV